MRKTIFLNRVHQTARRADCRNQIEPPSCCKVAPLIVDMGDGCCNRVEPAEVVEEPGVDAVGGEGGLDGRDVDGGNRNRLSLAHPFKYSRDYNRRTRFAHL